MLVLYRRIDEEIVIDGRIVVKVIKTTSGGASLGITAPLDVTVHRREVAESIARDGLRKKKV